MDRQAFDMHRGEADTRSGPISYVDIGDGHDAVLFIHGMGANGFIWRKVIDRLGPSHRCLALDLPVHGQTRASLGDDASLEHLVTVVEDFCDALALESVDLVGNDTGTAIAQVFAARHSDRVRTLTLTNGGTQVHVVDAFSATLELAASGQLSKMAPQLLADADLMRASAFGQSFEHPDEVSGELFRLFLEPVLGTPERAREFERLLVSLDTAESLLAVEDDLRSLETPTLIVWGTGDLFFTLKEARWLRATIPGATELIEIPGGRLFIPEEHPRMLSQSLGAHLTAHGDRTGRGSG